jgi:hypothetical protein
MSGDDLIAWVGKVNTAWRLGVESGAAPTAWVATFASVA